VKSIWSTFQLMLTATGGYIGYFLGGWDGFLYALVAFVVIDYVTGLMVAILNKKLSSEIGARGIFKKVLIFIMVGIGHTIDMYLIQNGSAIRTAVIFLLLPNSHPPFQHTFLNANRFLLAE
jgi:toxin secretion/phage lysis holin